MWCPNVSWGFWSGVQCATPFFIQGCQACQQGNAMNHVDAAIFGNSKLHQEFCLATQILAVLMHHAPQPVAMASLTTLTGQASRELIRICSRLWQTRLIVPAANGEGWMLPASAQAQTLEDVFRSVMHRPSPHLPDTSNDMPVSMPVSAALEIFIGQAAITVNQAVYQLLRQYPLERLRNTGPVPAMRNTARYDAGSELAHAGT